MLSINSMRTATVERHSLVRMGLLSVGPAFLTRKAHIIKDEQARCGQSKVNQRSFLFAALAIAGG